MPSPRFLPHLSYPGSYLEIMSIYAFKIPEFFPREHFLIIGDPFHPFILSNPVTKSAKPKNGSYAIPDISAVCKIRIFMSKVPEKLAFSRPCESKNEAYLLQLISSLFAQCSQTKEREGFFRQRNSWPKDLKLAKNTILKVPKDTKTFKKFSRIFNLLNTT